MGLETTARVVISHGLTSKHMFVFYWDFSKASLPLQGCTSTRMMSLFNNNFVIECSILAIPHASYNKGSKGMGSATNLPTISGYKRP